MLLYQINKCFLKYIIFSLFTKMSLWPDEMASRVVVWRPLVQFMGGLSVMLVRKRGYILLKTITILAIEFW